MRAFIFSLDAFVAFTIALVAIYSLIFFSSVPSAYYYLLTQGHYLSRDTLQSLSTATCADAQYGICLNPAASVLDNIVAEDKRTEASWESNQKTLVNNTVGTMIPKQFGYTLEISGDGGSSWGLVYDSGSEAGDPHLAKPAKKKLSVSTQILTFGYSGTLTKLMNPPYNYNSCHGDAISEGDTKGTDKKDWGIITCGENPISGGGSLPLGNTRPSDILGMGGGDLVPSSDVELVKLTVYI